MILSDYLEKKLIDLLLVDTAYAPPATIYFGLFTADPGESGVTSEFTIATGAYARAVVTNNTTNFPLCAITGEPTKVSGAIFSFPTATLAWGTATHWAIFDSASGATNMLAHGSLATPRAVAAGDTPKIASGGISITTVNSASGGLTAYAKRKLLDHAFGATTYSRASTVYSGLGTALSGDYFTEWTDSNYSRQSTAFTAATLGAGTCPNTTSKIFNAGVGSAATITHYGIWDAVSAGNLLVTGQIDSSRVVAASDDVSLAAGALVVSFQ